MVDLQRNVLKEKQSRTVLSGVVIIGCLKCRKLIRNRTVRKTREILYTMETVLGRSSRQGDNQLPMLASAESTQKMKTESKPDLNVRTYLIIFENKVQQNMGGKNRLQKTVSFKSTFQSISNRKLVDDFNCGSLTNVPTSCH